MIRCLFRCASERRKASDRVGRLMNWLNLPQISPLVDYWWDNDRIIKRCWRQIGLFHKQQSHIYWKTVNYFSVNCRHPAFPVVLPPSQHSYPNHPSPPHPLVQIMWGYHTTVCYNLCISKWLGFEAASVCVPAGCPVTSGGGCDKKWNQEFLFQQGDPGASQREWWGGFDCPAFSPQCLPYGEQKDQLLAPCQSKGKHRSTYA